MHYLKCNNCGHLNEIKSEYMTFCVNCDKKLDNNYTSWKKRHHDKTFEDYKSAVCVTEATKHEPVVKHTRSPKKTVYWLGAILAIIIISIAGNYGGKAIVRLLNSHNLSNELVNEEWIKYKYGDSGLYVETPIKLTKKELPVPDHIGNVIEQIDSYEYFSTKGLEIIINSVKYKPEIGETSLEGAANGSANEMKLQKGVSDFIYTEEFTTKDNIPGFIQKGSFKMNGTAIEFINTGFAKDLYLWQVMIGYTEGDEVGQMIANRVIQSIEFK